MAAAGKAKAPAARPARSGAKKAPAKKAAAGKVPAKKPAAGPRTPGSKAPGSKAPGSKAAGSKTGVRKAGAVVANVEGDEPARLESVVRPRNLISVLARKRLAGRHGVTPKGQRRQMNQAVKQLVDDDE